METLPYKLCIYPGVDIRRALRCVVLYMETEYAKCTGRNSLCIFGYYQQPDDKGLHVYRTETMIVVRNNG